jgi:uncharacterized protein YyaL (SSP411 family)
MLLALDFLLGTTKEIVLIEPASGLGADELRGVLRGVYTPNRIVVIATEGNDLEEKSQLVPLLAGKVVRNGRATAYVCENRVCLFPTDDPATFAAQLASPPPTPN